MHHEQDMKKMGALRKYMPITAYTFIIGWLSIAGVPPFSGFWSKDEILLAAYHKSPILWAVGLITALLTAYYMTRQVRLVFYGEERFAQVDHDDHPADAEEAEHANDAQHEADHTPHESPWVMTAPLVVLAALAAVGGLLNLPFAPRFAVLSHFLHPVFGESLIEAHSATTLKLVLVAVTTLAALVGVVYGWTRWSSATEIPSLEPRLLANAYNADGVVDTLVVRPSRALADASFAVDANVVDGAVNGVATLVGKGGGVLRTAQTGYVRSYALVVAGGTAALLAWVVFRSFA
jgi:NADH-quinone oxidoreductase subunit L